MHGKTTKGVLTENLTDGGGGKEEEAGCMGCTCCMWVYHKEKKREELTERSDSGRGKRGEKEKKRLSDQESGLRRYARLDPLL